MFKYRIKTSRQRRLCAFGGQLSACACETLLCIEMLLLTMLSTVFCRAPTAFKRRKNRVMT